jgi:hypothetical protein
MNYFALASLRSQQAIAIVTLLAVVAWAIGLPHMFQKADAATLELVSDTITDSDFGADARHTVQFTTPNGITTGGTVGFRVYFDPSGTAFDLSALTNGDVASSTTHVVRTGSGSCGGGTDFFVNSINTTSDYVEYLLCTGDTLASSTVVNFIVGSTTANMITNPSSPAASYVIRVQGAGGQPDSGDTRVAIIDDVTVSATVETTLSFTIAGVTGATTTNGDAVLTSATTTATTVAFGTVVPNTAETLAQDLTVTTNALNGFTVTVQADQTLTSGNGADIDLFANGSEATTTGAWSSPTDTFGTENTYGHWGVTTEDSSLSGGDTFGTALYAGNFKSYPREVFYHTGPADGATPHIGATRVGYKIEVGDFQEAATDYTATLTYVATPVF